MPRPPWRSPPAPRKISPSAENSAARTDSVPRPFARGRGRRQLAVAPLDDRQLAIQERLSGDSASVRSYIPCASASRPASAAFLRGIHVVLHAAEAQDIDAARKFGSFGSAATAASKLASA